MNRPCPQCGGCGLYGYVHGQHMPCPTCNGTGTVEPGPPTSPESPQTLGVTAGTAIGTDEGGPGTIEAGQGFEEQVTEYIRKAVKYPHEHVDPYLIGQILAAHEVDCAQREAQAVNAVLDKLLEHGHGGGNWRRLIEQLRATGTGEGTNTN